MNSPQFCPMRKTVVARMSTAVPRVLRVGGVPEHFNTPWHTAAKVGLFAAQGIDLRWSDFPGGTGAMAAALRDGELDVAILLTEGMVADIHKGNPARLIGTYVASPLTWGIHVSASSPLTDTASLYSQPAPPRFAVSRMTSGSHLMAFVDARRRAGDAAAAALRFEIVGTLEGARVGLREGTADAFMWEKFTTKPLVDSGEWRRIGECVTEWPCFSLAATPQALATIPTELRTALRIVASEAERLRSSPDAAEVSIPRVQMTASLLVLLLLQLAVQEHLSYVEKAKASPTSQSPPHAYPPGHRFPLLPTTIPTPVSISKSLHLSISIGASFTVQEYSPGISIYLSFYLSISAPLTLQQVIGAMYGLQPADVSEWIQTVEWASAPAISFSMLRHVSLCSGQAREGSSRPRALAGPRTGRTRCLHPKVCPSPLCAGGRDARERRGVAEGGAAHAGADGCSRLHRQRRRVEVEGVSW